MSTSHASGPRRRSVRAFKFAALVCVLACAPAARAGDEGVKSSVPAGAARDAAPAVPATAAEVSELRRQLEDANRRLEQLTDIVIKLQAQMPAGATATPVAAAVSSVAPTTDSVVAQDKPSGGNDDEKLIDQLIKPKSQGGQFAGSEGLFKTDRVKIGGYADFRFVTRSLDDGIELQEEIDGIGSGADTADFSRSTFHMPRLVIGVAAAITEKLLFNSEIEYEFGGDETEVEQAYLEYRLHKAFNPRAGIIIAPLGRFNLYHDSNLLDITPRPLVSSFIIPSTYSDSGIGALGSFDLGKSVKLSYEGYVVNGLRSDEEGEIVREAGLAESKGLNKLVDNNGQKAAVGRIVLSPALGLELGASGYRGKHDARGFYDLSIWAFDGRYQYKGFQVQGEYARSAMQRDQTSDEEAAARAFLLGLPGGTYTSTFEDIDENINEPLFDTGARASDGFYIEGRYRFTPRWLTEHFADDASIAPVFRYDQINLDRQFEDFKFPLNRRRTSVGLSIRPTEAAGFNFAVHFEADPKIKLFLTDGRPFPPYQTNIGKTAFSAGFVWAF